MAGHLPPFPKASSVPFPYEKPYKQQFDLMETFLSALQQKYERGADTEKKSNAPVLLLESPTGTGKSLSLACAALTWLYHMESIDVTETVEMKTNDASTAGISWIDSWVPQSDQQRAIDKEKARTSASKARKELSNSIMELRERVGGNSAKRENLLRSAITSARLKAKGRRKRKRIVTPSKQAVLEDYTLEKYESDDDNVGLLREEIKPTITFSDAGRLLNGARLDGSFFLNKAMDNPGLSTTRSHTVGNVKPGSGTRKIIYAARTHSQLSQFVGELRKTVWGKTVRVVAMGGRKALCGNHSLNHKSEKFITESCLDKQKSGPVCPLLGGNGDAVDVLALNILSSPTDIEEASKLGNIAQTCAYYASRKSLAAAEVVVLPYSMLLSKQTRASIGLSLEQNLVIIDESHNLPEALRSLHSCDLTMPVIQAALDQLSAYIAKYSKVLAGRNIHYLRQISKVLTSFLKCLRNPISEGDQRMFTSDELLIHLRLDSVNLYKLLRYFSHSRLSQKLLGFRNLTTVSQISETPENEDIGALSKHVSAMSLVENFLEKLSLADGQGMFTLDPGSARFTEDGSRLMNDTYFAFRYVLLNPSCFFENIIEEAYALALVGGTLRPFVHVAAELLNGEGFLKQASQADKAIQKRPSTIPSYSSISPNLTTFSCDHVVSSRNVHLQCLTRGPTNQVLDFRHRQRFTTQVCDELGRTLLSLCRTVPCGLVVFLPSYSYEAKLVLHWNKSGIWKEMLAEKKIHREPKRSTQVDSSLSAFARDAPTGALLLSVVGGKMSEGINFADDMARCVVVVGLPYPDITDPVLQEKMKTMDETSGLSGRTYYQNLCMRAVNQSVGRAVRHANDHAAIVLCDHRYIQENVWNGLPEWLTRGSEPSRMNGVSFEERRREMKKFFQRMKNDV